MATLADFSSGRKREKQRAAAAAATLCVCLYEVRGTFGSLGFETKVSYRKVFREWERTKENSAANLFCF